MSLSLLLPKFPAPMRIYLVKALLPLCALMLLVLPQPSKAGYWETTYTSTGTTTVEDGTAPPFDTTYTFCWLGNASSYSSQPGWFDESTTGAVTATLDWQHDNMRDPDADPPPNKVLIDETSLAENFPSSWAGHGLAPSASGSVSDGLGDPPVGFVSGGYGGDGYMSSGTHLIQKDGSSGHIELDAVTLSAANPTTSWSSGGPDWLWEGTVEVAFAASVVADEPIPVNFRQTKATDNGDGTLSFQYMWDSSTGNQADLSQWSIQEFVTYKNNPAGVGFFQNNQNGVYCYFPPDPFEGGMPEPTKLGVPATDFSLADDQLYSGFSTPYKEASFIGTQTFIAVNSVTQEKMNLLGPFTITRSFDNVYCAAEGDYYEYTVTKNGTTATLYLGTGL